MRYKSIIDGWDKKLDVAMKTGKGKFANCLVSDIHDYKRIIRWVRAGKFIKAFNEACDLDTVTRDEIPMTIWKILEDGCVKEYYK